MHAEVAGSTICLDAPTPAPKIRVLEGDIGDRWSLEAAVIEVENERGEFARFWVSVRVEKGRPKIYLTTKIGKADDRKQIEKSVQGTFNLI